MKRIGLLAGLLFLGACSDVSRYTTVSPNASVRQKMQACMISEANSRLQSGTLFANTVRATAEDITNTCLKKLALQAAGISEESQSAAENIINNLRALKNN